MELVVEGMYVQLWLICIISWQKPTQHCNFLNRTKNNCQEKNKKMKLYTEANFLYLLDILNFT